MFTLPFFNLFFDFLIIGDEIARGRFGTVKSGKKYVLRECFKIILIAD